MNKKVIRVDDERILELAKKAVAIKEAIEWLTVNHREIMDEIWKRAVKLYNLDADKYVYQLAITQKLDEYEVTIKLLHERGDK